MIVSDRAAAPEHILYDGLRIPWQILGKNCATNLPVVWVPPPRLDEITIVIVLPSKLTGADAAITGAVCAHNPARKNVTLPQQFVSIA
jgi:hypothetical protein